MDIVILILTSSFVLGLIFKFVYWNVKGYLKESRDFLDKYDIKFYLQYDNDQLPFISTSLNSIIMNIDKKVYGSSFLNGVLNEESCTKLNVLGNDEFIFSYNFMYFKFQDNTFFSALELLQSKENYMFFENKLFIPIPFYVYHWKRLLYSIINFFQKIK